MPEFTVATVVGLGLTLVIALVKLWDEFKNSKSAHEQYVDKVTKINEVIKKAVADGDIQTLNAMCDALDLSARMHDKTSSVGQPLLDKQKGTTGGDEPKP